MLDLESRFLEPGETIVCFGDSLTAANPGYVSFLQEKLTANQVVNAGRGGDKTPWALTRFQADVLDRKPDAVSILLGANDARGRTRTLGGRADGLAGSLPLQSGLDDASGASRGNPENFNRDSSRGIRRSDIRGTGRHSRAILSCGAAGCK